MNKPWIELSPMLIRTQTYLWTYTTKILATHRLSKYRPSILRATSTRTTLNGKCVCSLLHSSLTLTKLLSRLLTTHGSSPTIRNSTYSSEIERHSSSTPNLALTLMEYTGVMILGCTMKSSYRTFQKWCWISCTLTSKRKPFKRSMRGRSRRKSLTPLGKTCTNFTSCLLLAWRTCSATSATKIFRNTLTASEALQSAWSDD